MAKAAGKRICQSTYQQTGSLETGSAAGSRKAVR